MATIQREHVEVRLTHPAHAPAAVAALRGMAAGPPQVAGVVVRVAVTAGDGAMMEAARRLDRAGVGADAIAMRRPALDEVVLALVG
ncbi:MAG: hypothetical protein HZB46_13770 [Solirubrobacterales bacterium]|nr:hypothetical protein [Solirubrobacterales bacterium]